MNIRILTTLSIFGFLFLLPSNEVSAQHACKSSRADASALDPRSDTIDILHTDILIDLSTLPLAT